MPKGTKSVATVADQYSLDRIKKLVVISMFSDDALMEHLVLKGGNAIDLIHEVSSRASVDVDFSMQEDFFEDIDRFRTRIEATLRTTFRAEGLEVFDVKMEVQPEIVTKEIAKFWGGYGIEFKVIEGEKFRQYSADIEQLRKYAMRLGQGTKFLIDISKFEYTLGKEARNFDGYRIFVYTPEMIVCEKLRAICQQMSEYSSIVNRNRSGAPRAKDFVDIYTLVNTLALDITLERNQILIKEMFNAKRVPLQFVGLIGNYRDFHRADFPAVVASMKAGVRVEEFNVYFDFVVGLGDQLKPLWDI